MLFDEPRRRRRGRRTEHDLDTSFREDADRLVEPVEVELAAPWFEPGPGELAEAGDRESGFRHQ